MEVRYKIMSNEVDVKDKVLLTLEEAAAYTGVGINKLRKLSNNENCKFVIFIGTKRMLKREALKEYLSKQYSI